MSCGHSHALPSLFPRAITRGQAKEEADDDNGMVQVERGAAALGPGAMTRAGRLGNSGARIQHLAPEPLLGLGAALSNEKLFEKVEATLERKLTPDERKFQILANKTLERERLQNVNESTRRQ